MQCPESVRPHEQSWMGGSGVWKVVHRERQSVDDVLCSEAVEIVAGSFQVVVEREERWAYSEQRADRRAY